MAQQIPIRDLVSEEFRTGDYPTIRATMEKNLTRPEKIDRYATHESGHLLFFLRRGLMSPSEAIYGRPTILRLQDGSIGYFVAGVTSSRISLLDKTLVYDMPLLEKLADIGVAGNVLELNKYDVDEETEIGVKGDFKTFFDHCYEARARNAVKFEAYSMWTNAFGRVQTELRENPLPDSLIDSTKQVIRKRCFGVE
jgi:hypothetical protein